MNRLHHVRQTLSQNIESNRHYKAVEFILLDYSSNDGLADWVQAQMAEHIKAGLLLFAQAAGYKEFCMAHAKNLAHRLATGDIVCNLDADNFSGPDFAGYLAAQFANDGRIIMRGDGGRGTGGRIALRREDFIVLGGYDERMRYGWGYEDCDLYERACAFGLKPVGIAGKSPYLSAIRHSHTERTRHYRQKDPLVSAKRHRWLSSESLRRKEYSANHGKPWGAGSVLVNFTETMELSPRFESPLFAGSPKATPLASS